MRRSDELIDLSPRQSLWIGHEETYDAGTIAAASIAIQAPAGFSGGARSADFRMRGSGIDAIRWRWPAWQWLVR